MSEAKIVPETPLTTVGKLVSHATAMLRSGDEENALALMDIVSSSLAEMDPYLDRISTNGPASLDPLIQETIRHDWKKAYADKKVSFPVSPHWSAGAYEGSFIAMVVKAFKAKRVLEIGMFTGTTTLCVAEALPADGKIVSLEIDQYFEDLAAPYWEKAGVKDKIEVQIGNANDSLSKMVASNGEPFDIIFIDADKEGYRGYYDTIMNSNLLRKGGLLLVDNTLYKGYPFTPQIQTELTKEKSAVLPNMGISLPNGEALIHFNEYVSKDERVQVIVLPIRDGVSWIMVK